MTHTDDVRVREPTKPPDADEPDDAEQPDDPDSDTAPSPLATDPRAQTGLGAVATAFGLLALIGAWGLDLFGDHGVPGPGLFPTGLAVAVIALGLLQVIVWVVRRTRTGPSPRSDDSDTRGRLRRAAMVWVALAFDMIAMEFLGFIPATVLLVAYLVVLVEQIKIIKALLVIIVVPGLAYLLFVFVLGVELPTSVLFETR